MRIKTIKMTVCILALLSLIALPSCFGSNAQGSTGPFDDITELRLTPDEHKIAVFDSDGAYPEGFYTRNDRGNGFPFNCSFLRRNAVESNGTLSLILSDSNGGYAGAEFRSAERYSYGYYSVSMKAAKCSGVISSFFIYTGWPWDEIDIEFLGNDTTKVQFNYYTNGVGGHEYVYDLGFDASKEFHEYGFDWQEDSITWYVDGIAVYRATVSIPSHAGNIMMNIWNVADEHAGWAGKFYGSGLPVSAQYQWIGYQSAQ